MTNKSGDVTPCQGTTWPVTKNKQTKRCGMNELKGQKKRKTFDETKVFLCMKKMAGCGISPMTGWRYSEHRQHFQALLFLFLLSPQVQSLLGVVV